MRLAIKTGACLAVIVGGTLWLALGLIAPAGRPVAAAAAAGGVAAFALGSLASWLLLRPLGRLSVSASRVASGEKSVRFPESGAVEFRLIGREFNRMAFAVEQGARAQEEFAARLTHDLRSPLNAILLHAGLLLAGAKGALSAEMTGTVAALHLEGERLADMVEDVLAVAGLEMRPPVGKPEPVHLRPLLLEMIAAAASRWRPRRIYFNDRVAPQVRTAFADPGLLRASLGRLLDLAADSAPAEESVRVGGRRRSSGIRLEVHVHTPTPERRRAAAELVERFPGGAPLAGPLGGASAVRFMRVLRLATAGGGRAWAEADDRELRLCLEFPEAR